MTLVTLLTALAAVASATRVGSHNEADFARRQLTERNWHNYHKLLARRKEKEAQARRAARMAARYGKGGHHHKHAAAAPVEEESSAGVPAPVAVAPTSAAEPPAVAPAPAAGPTAPKAGNCTVTVLPGGSIQDAVDGLTAGGVVCISAGTYKEQVHVKPGQDDVTFIGLGRVVITGSDSQSKAGNLWLAGTLLVEGADFKCLGIDLTIENSVVTRADPSPALVLNSASSYFENVQIEGWHDTLGVRTGAHLIKSSFISGKSDFIFGFGRLAVVDSEIFVRLLPGTTPTQFKGHITTFGTEPSVSTAGTAGAVFHGCRVTGDGLSFLGRPYRPETVVVWNQCSLSSAVLPAGWDDFMGNIEAGKFVFQEYGSTGPGAADSRTYGTVFSGAAPAEYSPEAWVGMA